MSLKKMTSIMHGRERFSIWRKRNRVRQIDVAKYLGCCVSTISQWENHQINISDELLANYNKFIDEFEAGNIKFI